MQWQYASVIPVVQRQDGKLRPESLEAWNLASLVNTVLNTKGRISNKVESKEPYPKLPKVAAYAHPSSQYDCAHVHIHTCFTYLDTDFF